MNDLGRNAYFTYTSTDKNTFHDLEILHFKLADSMFSKSDSKN